MRSLVLLGVLCAAAVNAGNSHGSSLGGGFYPYYSDGYVVYHPLMLKGAATYPQVYEGAAPYYPQYVASGAGPQNSMVPSMTVVPPPPSPSLFPGELGVPISAAGRFPGELGVPISAPGGFGGPGGSAIFAGTGEVTAAGTGLGFFAGEGVVDFAGAFPAGAFMGQGQAQFDGAGQIQVETVPGVGVVGGFQNFVGQGGFQGVGAAAAIGTGVVNAQGTGIAGLVGDGVVNVDGVGQTFINPMRGARRYDVPAVSTYNTVLPSYGTPAYNYNGYSTYGSLYNGGYLPRSYGTYRLIRPAPVAGVSGTTYAPAYGYRYAPQYKY